MYPLLIQNKSAKIKIYACSRKGKRKQKRKMRRKKIRKRSKKRKYRNVRNFRSPPNHRPFIFSVEPTNSFNLSLVF